MTLFDFDDLVTKNLKSLVILGKTHYSSFDSEHKVRRTLPFKTGFAEVEIIPWDSGEVESS
jgi:hypothetical protein